MPPASQTCTLALLGKYQSSLQLLGPKIRLSFAPFSKPYSTRCWLHLQNMPPIWRQTTAPHCCLAPSITTLTGMASVILATPTRAPARHHTLPGSQTDGRAGRSFSRVNYTASSSLSKTQSLCKGLQSSKWPHPLLTSCRLPPAHSSPGSPAPCCSSNLPAGPHLRALVVAVSSVPVYSFSSPRAGLPNLGTTDILEQMILHCGGLPWALEDT